MNVVIYARYSSHNQTEQSIEGQIAVCKEYADRNNYTIVGEYIDRSLTGTNDNRPQFRKMIEDSNKRFFNGVLVYQLDRFSRNRYDSAIYKNKLKKNGVRVFSAKENISEDASGILMESVIEGMAEYYSVELSQKVKRGMDINAQKCLSTGGTPPLGFKVNKEKKFEINEMTAPIVKQIFQMYANGKLMSDIIKKLNEKGIKTSQGHKFNKCSIRTILLNKKYIGIYTYKGKEYKGGIPRIIDDETFYKVQKMMSKNKKAPARAKSKTDYLLTTKLFCGYCKELMVGVCGTSYNGKIYHYYSCNGYRNKKCNKKNIKKDYIEDLVVKEVKNILTDNNIKEIANKVVELSKKETNNVNVKNLEILLKENKKQQTNLLNSLKVCQIESVRNSIFQELEKMQLEYTRLEKEYKIEKSKYTVLKLPEVLFFLYKLKNGDINDIKYKKVLIHTFINKIYLYDNNMIIIFNTQDKEININIPNIEKINSSLKGNCGQPKVKGRKLNFLPFTLYKLLIIF